MCLRRKADSRALRLAAPEDRRRRAKMPGEQSAKARQTFKTRLTANGRDGFFRIRQQPPGGIQPHLNEELMGSYAIAITKHPQEMLAIECRLFGHIFQ